MPVDLKMKFYKILCTWNSSISYIKIWYCHWKHYPEFGVTHFVGFLYIFTNYAWIFIQYTTSMNTSQLAFNINGILIVCILTYFLHCKIYFEIYLCRCIWLCFISFLCSIGFPCMIILQFIYSSYLIYIPFFPLFCYYHDVLVKHFSKWLL